MPRKAVFALSVLLLSPAPALAFHNSELDAETKQSLIRTLESFSALGDSLAQAQRACAQGDQRACQFEQQGKAFVRQLDQGMATSMAPRPGGPPGGGFGTTAPPPGGRPGMPPGSMGGGMGGYGGPPSMPPGTMPQGNMPQGTMPPGGPYGGGYGGAPPGPPGGAYGGGMPPHPGQGTVPPWGGAPPSGSGR